MLYEINPQEFGCLPALFNHTEHSLVIRSIAAGHTMARAWVDRPQHPTIALVWNRLNSLYLAGDLLLETSIEDLHGLLVNTIIPAVRELGWMPEIELFYELGTIPAPPRLLPEEYKSHPAVFNSYRLVQPTAGRDLAAPAGFHLEPVTRDFLLLHNLERMDDLTGWILSFYSSLDDFLKTGFGFVAIFEEKPAIASLCISAFVAPSLSGTGTDYELGLATTPDFQGKGLATLVAAASVKHCVQNGNTPVWHCWADNTPSARVAEKVGFRLLRQTEALKINIGEIP